MTLQQMNTTKQVLWCKLLIGGYCIYAIDCILFLCADIDDRLWLCSYFKTWDDLMFVHCKVHFYYIVLDLLPKNVSFQ
jgi:hypothetical protein